MVHNLQVQGGAEAEMPREEAAQEFLRARVEQRDILRFEPC
jgi:hypothetical protein